MKHKALNVSLVVAAVLILAVAGLYVRVGATADAVVVLKTSGMTCSSCVEKVTRALQSERGVAATEVDLQGGRAIAGYDSKQVAPEQLARKARATGFDSKVQAVLSPEQFEKTTGHTVGRQETAAGSCGAKGCCGR